MAASSKENDANLVDSGLKLGRPRDLIFVLDSSGSMSEDQLDRALTFTRRIVGLLDVSQTGTRVAMVNFGTKVKVEFSLHHHSTEEQIQKAIEKVDPLGGSTNTAAALEKVVEMCEKRHLPEHPLIIVLITDGRTDNRHRASHMADILKVRWGAHFFTVGVGSSVNESELGALASSPENVLLVDSYKALKHVTEKIAIKLCTVVRRPRFNPEVTNLTPPLKLLLLGPTWKNGDSVTWTSGAQEEHPVSTINAQIIHFLRQADPDASRINISYLILKPEEEINELDRKEAEKSRVALIGSRPPIGCPTPPSTEHTDVFITAFFQHVLHSRPLADVTHVFGYAPYTSHALHNIANALEGIHGVKPRRVLLGTAEEISGHEHAKLVDVFLRTDGPGRQGSDFEKKHQSASLSLFDGEADGDERSTDDVIHSPSNVLLHSISGGVTLDIILSTHDANVELKSKPQLKKSVKTIRTILESQSSDSDASADDEFTRAWQVFLASVQENNRNIVTAKHVEPLTLRMTLFCAQAQSVKHLWESFNRDKPAMSALDRALGLSGVGYEICDVIIWSEGQEMVGSVVHSSEKFARVITEIIKERKKTQDREWTTMHGAEKDRKIAKEMETRRLEQRWLAVEEEAREVMGERGVEAIQRAREQAGINGQAELLQAIEASIEAGGFMEFLKDIVSKLCRIM